MDEVTDSLRGEVSGDRTEVGPTELTEQSATDILKDWLSMARHLARSHTNLHELVGIDRNRIAMLVSVRRKDFPTPDELTKISAGTGYPVHDLALQASHFLHALSPNSSALIDPLIACEISCRHDLKVWIKSARKKGRSGRLTQSQLSGRLGRSQMTVASWENTRLNRVPKAADIKAIAAACGVPEPTILFERRSYAARVTDLEQEQEVANTLEDEILQAGRLLSRRAHALANVERNAHVFRARYGGRGDDESTLQAIGDAHGLTRERIRQIVDKQLSFLACTPLNTTCFDAVASACLKLEPLTVAVAEERLRHLLGFGLSLQGASDYGREVLGKALPIQLLPIRNGETIVIAGDQPSWFQAAITQSKAIIRHCGAAQLNLAWALTMQQHQDWIAPDQFRQVIIHVPGFEWIDDDEAWFWFGPEGSANRLVKRTVEILKFAKRPLDIEVIYGGLTRYARTRTSDVSEQAGIWPPMDVVRMLLSKSPALVCQQGDDFRLAEDGGESDEKKGVAELILFELRLRGGLASRSELHQALVVNKAMNPVSFSVALAHSPLLSQVDRGVFAIRGWPISAARLTEAQSRVGNVSGSRINFKEVDVTSSGDVSWVNVLSKSSMSNMYAGVPRKALLHLPEGQYAADGALLSITDQRMVGLIRLVVGKGGIAGSMYRTTVNARMRTAEVEIIGLEDADDEYPV